MSVERIRTKRRRKETIPAPRRSRNADDKPAAAEDDAAAAEDEEETTLLLHSRSDNANTSKATTIRTAGRCIPVSSRFDKVGRLGQGTYGVVYKAHDRCAKINVALKRCRAHRASTDGFPVTTLREVENLRLCRACPYIVKLLDVAASNSSSSAVFLVLECCDFDLADLLDRHYERHKRSPFREEACKTLLHNLLSALEFLHARRIYHRDVKMSNLLYHRGVLKLADLGLSRHVAPDSVLTPKVASLWYRAPELLLWTDEHQSSSSLQSSIQQQQQQQRQQYTSAIDMWATGCVWPELLQGKPLLMAKDEVEQIHQIHRKIGIPNECWPAHCVAVKTATTTTTPARKFSLLDGFGFLSAAGCQLLTSLLQVPPRDRWTAAQALRSPYFAEAPLPLAASHMPRFR